MFSDKARPKLGKQSFLESVKNGETHTPGAFLFNVLSSTLSTRTEDDTLNSLPARAARSARSAMPCTAAHESQHTRGAKPVDPSCATQGRRFRRHCVGASIEMPESQPEASPGARVCAAETKVRWEQWRNFSTFALSSTSVFSAACDEESSLSGESDGDERPQRHPLEVQATERFLASDLVRRVRNAQAEMPPLTIEEKITLPAWMSWGRGSAWQDTAEAGDASSTAPAAAVLIKQHDAPILAAATSEHTADVNPKPRGRMSRAVRKISKRLPNLRIMAAAALSTPVLRLPTVSVSTGARTQTFASGSSAAPQHSLVLTP